MSAFKMFIFKKLSPYLIIVMSLLLFLPALNNFFWGDDWYHLRISQANNFQQFSNFFSFSQTPQSTPFYRPISTQLFFFSFNRIFGLNALPYYLMQIVAFVLSLYLVYRLAYVLTKNNKLALFTIFFYGISATNFPRVYYLSNFQEILMVIFVILSLLNYLGNTLARRILSLIFFLLALGSKETAMVLPVILVGIELIKGKFSLKRLAPYFLILSVYLIIRLLNWNTVGKDSYDLVLSPIKYLNTLFWYMLWSFGTPELLVDYIGSGLRVLPKFYTDFPIWSYILLILTSLTLATGLGAVYIRRRFINAEFIFFAGFFVIGLLPVSFFPWHKFAYELTLSMVGFSLMLAFLTIKGKLTHPLIFSFITLFIILNLVTNWLDYSRHYSITRSQIAQKVILYFSLHYQTPPENSYFEFTNDTIDLGSLWGSSKQISQAVSGSNLFEVLYKDSSYKVYYEDIPGDRPKDKIKIPISTAMFLR